jgi:glycosyltransferase involved in cell wall biosynthesis
MTQSPLVSVCIPTFNGEATIRQALKSVLNQTFKHFEVVIADDESTDSTLQVVKSIADERVRVLESSPKTTAAANWNRSVNGAIGKYVKVMGQDDVLYPRCLEAEIAAIGSPDVFFCFSRRDVISQNGRILFKDHGLNLPSGKYELEDLLPRIIRSGSNPIGEPVATLFDRMTFMEAGGFVGNYVIDVDMWIRLLEFGPAIFTNETHVAFRVGDRSWSHQLRTSQAKETIILFDSVVKRHPQMVPRYLRAIGTIAAYFKQLFRVPAITTLNFIRW